MQTIGNIEIAIIQFLQNLGGWLAGPMKVLSFMGTVEFYLLLMPALYWCWDALLGLRLGVMLMLSAGMNEALKLAFHQPRPYWLDYEGPKILALSSERNFGFPSGHGQQAVSLWELLASSLRRRWIWAAALGLAFSIGVSRLYLGVHFPHDVLAGWLVGALLLWAFVHWEGPLTRWLGERGLGQKVVVSFLASLALLGLNALSFVSLGDWQVPPGWAEMALACTSEPIDPFSLKLAFDVAGVLFGMGAGAAWLSEAGGFRADGPIGKRLTRYLLGIVGLMVLWFGVRAVLPGGATVVAWCLRYLRSTLVGAWVSAGGPALFLRLGLAESKA